MSATAETNGNGLVAKTEKLSLTDREQEILSHAWNCMKTQPEIDYNKLAAECGMTNPRSASNAWSALKKKLFTNVPATPRGRKAAAPANGDDPVETGNAPSTGKRKRATPASKKKAAAAAAGDDEDDEIAGEDAATPTKKKRATPRKKATPAKTEPKNEEDEDKSAAVKGEEADEEKPKAEEANEEA